MIMQPMVTIDGIDLPPTSKSVISKKDLDSFDSGRNELGVLQRDRIRHGIYEIELSYELKKSSEIQTIESAIDKPELQVTFPTHSGRVTKTMFADNVSIDVALRRTNLEDTLWNISFNLIEY